MPDVILTNTGKQLVQVGREWLYPGQSLTVSALFATQMQRSNPHDFGVTPIPVVTPAKEVVKEVPVITEPVVVVAPDLVGAEVAGLITQVKSKKGSKLG